MFIRKVGLGSAVLVSLVSTRPANAQRVQADIRIGGGPIAGHVRIGDPRDRYDPRYYGYRPRQIFVERFGRQDRGWREGWFRQFQRQARRVAVYYDRRDDCYYDRFGPGLEEIQVFEQDGRFFRYDDRFDGRGDTRYDGRDGRRNDGRYDDRNGRGSRDNRDRRNWGDTHGNWNH